MRKVTIQIFVITGSILFVASLLVVSFVYYLGSILGDRFGHERPESGSSINPKSHLVDKTKSGSKRILATKSRIQQSSNKPYFPSLDSDPPVPTPPPAASREFQTFLERLKSASKKSVKSLVFHGETLSRAEKLFRNTVGVPAKLRMEMHRPFFTVNPESIFALYYDLPSIERGFGLFQQHCSQCHGTYGRGNGSATRQWYNGNLPRNFWYGKFKSRSTKYGTPPTDRDLFRTLTRGLYGSSMPSFRHLSTQDRWSLIQFVKTLANFYDDYDDAVVNQFDSKPKEKLATLFKVGDEPPVSLKTVIRGRILFIKQGCVKCHQGSKSKPVGLSRKEGAFTNWTDEMNRPIEHSRNLTTRVFRSGAASTDLFRIITGGPTIGPMPGYQIIPIQDRWALVHYVQSLFKPNFPQAPPSVDALAKPPKKSGKKPSSATQKKPS